MCLIEGSKEGKKKKKRKNTRNESEETYFPRHAKHSKAGIIQCVLDSSPHHPTKACFCSNAWSKRGAMNTCENAIFVFALKRLMGVYWRTKRSLKCINHFSMVHLQLVSSLHCTVPFLPIFIPVWNGKVLTTSIEVFLYSCRICQSIIFHTKTFV